MKTKYEILVRTLILSYNVGSIQKDVTYWERADEQSAKAYQDHLKTDLADVWVQLRELMIDCGFDPYQLEEFALERYAESKKEVQKRLGSTGKFLESNW